MHKIAIGVGCIVSGILVLVIARYKQKKELTRQKGIADVATNNYNKANAAFKNAFAELFTLIDTAYGGDTGDAITDGKIKQGFPGEFVVLAWGEPDDKAQNVLNNTYTEKWYYHPYINRLGNRKHKLEVTLQNNIVIGWRDLN